MISVCHQNSASLKPFQAGAQNVACEVNGSLSEWIHEIRKVWTRGTASTLELARVVSAAKTGLPYGQWSQLWKSGRMPFSKSTADRLAVIGQRMGGLDSATSLNLPRGWNTLYCLARLDQETLTQLIEQGVVHSGLTLRQAKELGAQLRGKCPTAKARKVNIRERLLRFADFLDVSLPAWTPEERELAQSKLREILHQIEAVENPFTRPEFEIALADFSSTDEMIPNRFTPQRSIQRRL